MTQITAILLNHMGTDLDVVNAARVSFAKESREFSEKDAKLIHYLAAHKHMSPFGHCFMSFHVKAPIFVARQLVKHKFLRWNEVSRRYVDDEPEFYIPDVWRGKADNVKQGSSDEAVLEEEIVGFGSYCGHLAGYYQDLLDSGVAPEMARMVLPQNTMTEWWWSGSLDAFADMCNLRLDPHTQYESRLVAQQINEQAKAIFPVSWEALVKTGE